MAGYGSLPKEVDTLTHLSLHPQGARRASIDLSVILLNIVAPVVIFAIAFAALSFKLHYDYWYIAWVAALSCSLPGVYVYLQMFKAVNKYGENHPHGRWLKVLCIFCFSAWILGMILGISNFHNNLQPFYDMSGLNYYTSVDPSTSGQSHIDAGRLTFQPGSYVETKRAMGVKVSGIYCVAPIVNPNVPQDQREFDYWAVGTDCCSSVQPQDDWNCGEVSNHLATGGMRLMNDDPRPFYRMAVQEAEATYRLNAKHPIFVEWMQDPAAKMASWHANGVRFFVEWLLSFSVLMFFLACSAGIYFSRVFSKSTSCQGTGFFKYIQANTDHDFYAEEGFGPTKTTSIET